MSIKVTVYRNYVKVQYDNFKKEVLPHLYPLFMQLREFSSEKDWRTGKYVKKHVADWWKHERDIKTLRFHKAWTKDVLTLLKNAKNVTFKEEEHWPIQPISVRMKDFYKPKPRQVPYLEWICNAQRHESILPANPGEGKTVCALKAISVLGVRTAIILDPSLVDNWYKSMETFMEIDTDYQVRYVTEAKGIKKFQKDLIAGESNEEIVIFSLNSLRSFMKNYLTKDFPLTPEEMFALAGFGMKIIDEAHRNKHFHLIANCYSNFRNNLYLTGTLMPEFDFDKMIEESVYALKDRCDVPPPSSHVRMIGYEYEWEGAIPRCETSKGYNHMLFEAGVLKKKRRLRAYLQLTEKLIRQNYMANRQQGDVCLTFFSLTDTIEHAYEYFQKVFPELKICIYGAGDGEDVLEGMDLILATTKKAGTGLDVKGLTCVTQTIAISSKKENSQNLMRLRCIEDRTTTFAYLWCSDVEKHRDYHSKRQVDLKPYCNSIEARHSGVRIAA